MLGENLVVRFKDYGTDAHFFSILGQVAVVEAVAALLAHARREGLLLQLRLVPEAVIAADERVGRCFSVTADRDNFDYVYAVDAWAHFLHPGFREHRRLLARSRERADLDVRSFPPDDRVVQDAMVGLFHRWVAQKPALPGHDHVNELTALQRVFALAASGRLHACGFFDAERLVGFVIWEGLSGGEYAMLHFQKADRDYPGLSSWQNHAMGTLLEAKGYRLINGEQDLGIAGLRAHKRSLQPCRFLRKYVIAERGDQSAEREDDETRYGRVSCARMRSILPTSGNALNCLARRSAVPSGRTPRSSTWR